MKRTIRALGIGIFLSGAFVFFFGQSSLGQEESSTVKPGYQLIKTEELEQMKSNLKTANEQLADLQLSLSNTPSTPTTPSVEEPKGQDGKFLLSIESGATPVTISRDLKEAGIIANERDFINYLEDHKLSSKIQVGQYTVTSGMTLSEIAEIITK